MLQSARPPLRIGIVLHLLLLTDLVSPFRAVELEYFLGDTVTINCMKGCNKSLTRDNINQITWRKYNKPYILLSSISLNLNLTSSNFSMRFNFQDPLTLRIMDAQPSDSGNYSCQLSSTAGFCDNNFSLYVSGKGHQEKTVLYASTSAAGAVLLIIIIIGIVYWRTRPKTENPPDKIHQTSPETQEREEPVYDNADQNYCLRFNSLYDGLPISGTMQSSV